MAPVSTGQFFPLHKRDYENTTWRAILGAIGAFLLVGLIGILAGYWRNRLQKRRQKLQAASERGTYTKLGDERYSLEEAPSSNGIRVLHLQRTNSTSSSSSSSTSRTSMRQDEQRLIRNEHLQNRTQHQRSRSLSPHSPSAIRGRYGGSHIDSRCRSCSAQPINETHITLRGVITGETFILPPPRAAHVDLDHVVHTSYEDGRRLSRTRSPSPIRTPLVLSRSMSMLRPRSVSSCR